MAEKRYTVVFDAKDMATSRMSQIERSAKSTSRGMDDLAKETSKAARETSRLENAYRTVHGRLGDANGRFSRTRDLLNGTNSEMNRSGSFLSRMGTGLTRIGTEGTSSIHRLTTGLSGITGILGGIATAAGVAGVALAGMAAKGVWDNIVKPAMDVESTKLQINALSGSPEKGSDIYKMSQKFGMQSTYNNEDIMGGTFAFMQNTKDKDELKEMLKITERLAALNKEEGFRGASFSLKEAMSGDLQSIAERFNVAKKDLRDAGFDSAADWKTNLEAVDKALNKIGVNDAFVEKMKNSAPAQLARLEKNVKTSFASMGYGMVEELKPAFKKMNGLFEDETGLNKFTSTMSDKFRGFLQDVFSLGDGVKVTWKDITNWSAKTFDGVEDILKSTGKTFKTMMTILTGGDLEKPSDTFKNFGDILSGIAKKIDKMREGLIELDKLGDKIGKFTGIGQKGGLEKQVDGALWMPEGAKGGRGLLGWMAEGFPSEKQKPGDKPWWDGSHALGLSNVPKDNYIANLHQGERVLTRQENIIYTKELMAPKPPVANAAVSSVRPPATPIASQVVQEGNTSSTSITVNMNGVTIREEADIERLMQRFARELTLAGAKT